MTASAGIRPRISGLRAVSGTRSTSSWHVPDVFMTRRGRPEVIDVKPQRFVGHDVFPRQAELSEARCSRIGWVYRMATEPSAVAWVCAPGRRTITGTITIGDPAGRRAHDAYTGSCATGPGRCSGCGRCWPWTRSPGSLLRPLRSTWTATTRCSTRPAGRSRRPGISPGAVHCVRNRVVARPGVERGRDHPAAAGDVVGCGRVGPPAVDASTLPG